MQDQQQPKKNWETPRLFILDKVVNSKSQVYAHEGTGHQVGNYFISKNSSHGNTGTKNQAIS